MVTGANRHDVSQLENVLDNIVINRPEPTEDRPQNFCADAGYTGEPAEKIVKSRRYIPHIKSRGEEKKEIENIPGYKARRWVVEVSHSWMNRFRKIPVRYEKKDESYLALVSFACAVIAWRKTGIIYG